MTMATFAKNCPKAVSKTNAIEHEVQWKQPKRKIQSGKQGAQQNQGKPHPPIREPPPAQNPWPLVTPSTPTWRPRPTGMKQSQSPMMKPIILRSYKENPPKWTRMNQAYPPITKDPHPPNGGNMVCDPIRELMEDFTSSWDLIDINPTKGKFTWSNKRTGYDHTTARLDRFLLSGPLLSSSLIPSSSILPWDGFDHQPISLLLDNPQNLGPIPFCFNPLWLHDPSSLPTIEVTLESLDHRLPY
jgi:hypothetical protein